jgi:hypothetical protein
MFLADIEKYILIFRWNLKEAQISKTTLKKNKLEDFLFQNLVQNYGNQSNMV